MASFIQNIRNSKNRVPYIDNMKGLCILAITLLHYEDGILPHWLNTFIGSFMITGFYITNGWLHGINNSCSNLNVQQFLKKRIRSLGVPYLYFSIIILAFDIIFYTIGHIDTSTIYRDLYKTCVLKGIGTLWFLPVIFFGELLYVITTKYNIQKLCIFVGLFLWGFINSFINENVELYWTSPLKDVILAPLSVISNSIYAYITITLSSHLPQLMLKKYAQHIIFLLAVTTYLIIQHPLLQGIIQQIILFSWQFIISTTIFSIFILLKNQNYLFLKYLNFWGQNSLILMLTHYSIIMEFCIYINYHIFGNPTLSNWNAIFFFIITMIVEYPLTLLINKKFRFLLGK